MLPNVIILTGGICGSSVLAALISKEGYWVGKDTKKVAYDTYENAALVDHNIELFRKSGFFWRDVSDIPSPSPHKIGELHGKIDLNPYNQFVIENDKHMPWLWKDPRLSFTMQFWKKLVDIQKCKFILMTRDLRQTWTGLILRGKFAIPIEKLKAIHQSSEEASKHFLKTEGLDYLSLSFEDLIIKTERSIELLNRHIGTRLTINDFKQIYDRNIGRKRWTLNDFIKAQMKFGYYKFVLKNVVTFPRGAEV